LPAIADAAVTKMNQIKSSIQPYMALAPQNAQQAINDQIARVDAVIAGIQELLRLADCKFVAMYAERIVSDVCVDAM